MSKLCIVIDWLQLNLKGKVTDFKGFKRKTLDYSTRQFRKIDEFYLNNKLFCTVVSEPSSRILDENMMLLKIANEFLYDECCFTILDDLIKDNYLKVNGISRIDIAGDFNTFKQGLKPNNLITKFMTNEVRKIGKSEYKLQGIQKNTHVVDYLRFGKNTSSVSSYLYNKTKELNDVKMKPYIVDNWRCNELNTNELVWRLEFSIKSKSVKLVDEDTGEVKHITYEAIKDKKFIKQCYHTLVQSYFSFRKNTGKSNVTREKKIELFENQGDTLKRMIFYDLGDGSRADKIFIKKMENTNCELRQLKRSYSDECDMMLLDFIVEKGLEDFYLTKIKGTLVAELQKIKEDRIQELENQLNNTQYSGQLKMKL